MCVCVGGALERWLRNSMGDSSRGREFSSQQSHNSSQPPLIPVPGAPMSSSGCYRHQVHTWFIYTLKKEKLGEEVRFWQFSKSRITSRTLWDAEFQENKHSTLWWPRAL